MAEQEIRSNDSQLKNIRKEYRQEVLTERETIVEMAKLNLKDDDRSEFPTNAFRVWVQGEISSNQPPLIHILDKQEGYEIKVLIENGQLFGINDYGRRTKIDNFEDILEKVRIWFDKPTSMPGRIGTNKEAAYNEWIACNTD